MRLGSLLGQPQAQLNGFKSRALRSEVSTPRHLYRTEWRSLDAASAQSGATLVIGYETWTAECERLSPNASRHELAAMVGGDDWAVVVATVAIERECFAALPLLRSRWHWRSCRRKLPSHLRLPCGWSPG